MKKELSKFFIFYLITVVSLVLIGEIFIRKTLVGPFDNTNRINGFYNLSENTLDMIFVGSSHSYTGIDNVMLRDEYSIKSYNFSTPEQPIGLSYHFILEALKTQRPKVIVLESYMVNEYSEYRESVIRHATDNLPMSLNKYEIIQTFVNRQNRVYYYFPILKYHTRWDDLYTYDFDLSYKKNNHEYLGQVPLESIPQDNFNTDLKIDKSVRLSDEDMLYIDSIIELSIDYEFELILYTAPYNLNDEQYSKILLIDDYSKDNNIKHINMNQFINYFNYQTDFFDSSHLSKEGALKSTKIFMELIQSYELGD